MKLFFLTLVTLGSGLHFANAKAAPSELLVEPLKVGEYLIVAFKNPANESIKSVFYCLGTTSTARDTLADDGMGGMILLPGTKMVVKNDKENDFTSDDAKSATYIQIECKK